MTFLSNGRKLELSEGTFRRTGNRPVLKIRINFLFPVMLSARMPKLCISGSALLQNDADPESERGYTMAGKRETSNSETHRN